MLRLRRFQVSPDDGHAAFVTSDQITSYNTKDPDGPCSFGGNGITGEGYGDPLKEEPLNERCQEMYTYEPATGRIVCVSCNPSGAPPTHDVSASTQGLFMSNDGRTFFSTAEPLVQPDTNKVEDVYEYTEGRPRLITTGTDAADAASENEGGVAGINGGLAAVSADGTSVYFATRDTLVPQDENGQFIKFYDARTDGGFPFERLAPLANRPTSATLAEARPPTPCRPAPKSNSREAMWVPPRTTGTRNTSVKARAPQTPPQEPPDPSRPP